MKIQTSMILSILMLAYTASGLRSADGHERRPGRTSEYLGPIVETLKAQGQLRTPEQQQQLQQQHQQQQNQQQKKRQLKDACLEGNGIYQLSITVTDLDRSPLRPFRLLMDGRPAHTDVKSESTTFKADWPKRVGAERRVDPPRALYTAYAPMNGNLKSWGLVNYQVIDHPPEQPEYDSQREWLTAILTMFSPYKDEELGKEAMGATYEEMSARVGEVENVDGKCPRRMVMASPTPQMIQNGAQRPFEISCGGEGKPKIDLYKIELDFGDSIRYPQPRNDNDGQRRTPSGATQGFVESCVKSGLNPIHFESRNKIFRDFYYQTTDGGMTTEDSDVPAGMTFTWSVIPKKIVRDKKISTIVGVAEENMDAGLLRISTMETVITANFKSVTFEDVSSSEQRRFTMTFDEVLVG